MNVPKPKPARPRVQLSRPATILLMVLAALGITGVMFAVAPGSLRAFLSTLLHHPTLLLWNFFPVILLMLFLFFLSNSSPLACFVTGYIFILFPVINRVKCALREDPFVPTDLGLITECVDIARSYVAHYQLYIFLLFIVAPLVAVLLGIFFRDTPKKWRTRLIGLAVVVAAAAGLNQLVYKNEALYDSYPITGSAYFKVNQYSQKGWSYSFLKDANFCRVQKPAGYRAADYRDEEESFAAPDYTDEARPHIIMIMGEAFTDLSAAEAFDFTGYTDPLANYKEILADSRTVSGHILVPNFGGGTSDTEFDVLTGCSTRHIQGSQTSYSYISRPVEAIPSLLQEQGYDTLAIHPGNGWFYNRNNVYPYLGFNQFISLETGFDPATQNKGGYISDEACFDAIRSTFQTHLEESDDPLFSFTVTIQNHGPYAEKYLEQPQNFTVAAALTETEAATLSGYFTGIAATDDQLGQLVDYFDSLNEPVVLVFFGDHLPGFTGSMELFAKLGLPIRWDGAIEERLNIYKTPFFIWKNDAACALTGDIAPALPENGLISSFYLGSLSMELCGLPQLSPLFALEETLRQTLPVAASQSYMLSDGSFTEELPEDAAAGLEQLKGWSYYQLFQN